MICLPYIYLKWCSFLFFMCLFPVHTTMKSAMCMLTSEKERLKQMLEHESCPSPSAQLLGLKSALAAVSTHTHTHTHTLPLCAFPHAQHCLLTIIPFLA